MMLGKGALAAKLDVPTLRNQGGEGGVVGVDGGWKGWIGGRCGWGAGVATALLRIALRKEHQLLL